MAKYKLDIDDRDDYYCIGWYISDLGDFGLYLGETTLSDEEIRHRLATENILSERDALVAELAGRECNGEMDRIRGKLVWPLKSSAVAALRTIRLRIKTDVAQWMARKEATPWPEWATTALEAGWKPPKGWKP